VSPPEVAAALAQVAAFLAVGWLVSQVFCTAVLDTSDVGLPERALFAILGGVAFAVGMMLIHIATAGWAFATPGVVPLFAAALLWLGRRRLAWPHGIQGGRAALLAAALVAVFVLPVILGGTSVRTGDPPWHMGWSQQLLEGEPVPSGPAPVELARNAYPWGFHALLATLVRLVPGSDALVAHTAVHLLVVLGIPLAAAALARRVDVGAGWTAAAAVALVGGFGWLWARAPYFAYSPRAAEHGADLTVASPNAAYALFPPGVPREVGLILLAAAVVLVALGSGTTRGRVGSGLAAGVVGLVNVPLFAVALVWLASVAVFVERRPRALLETIVPALGVFALWAAPVVSGFLRYGGFVDITQRMGREWPVANALASWGLLVPGALAGGLVALRARTAGSRLLFTLAAATAALMSLALLRETMGWTVEGAETLLRRGRLWPVAHLLGAAFAGLAARRVLNWTARRSLALATGSAMLVIAVASPSLVLASIDHTRVISRGEAGFFYGGRDLAGDGFARSAARLLGPDDVIRVEGSDELAFLLFQLSGCRLAAFDDPRLERNDARIRYRDLADEWDRRTELQGIAADFVVSRSDGAGGLPLAEGEYGGERWVLTRR
jgi:hypothetical protein